MMREALPTRSPIAWVVGLLGGMLVAASLGFIGDMVLDAYDRSHPVWVGVRVFDVTREGDKISASLDGEKVRECRYLRVHARGLAGDYATDVQIKRQGQIQLGMTRPLGRQFIGRFDLWPTAPNMRSVAIIVEHQCGERLLLTPLATISVPQ